MIDGDLVRCASCGRIDPGASRVQSELKALDSWGPVAVHGVLFICVACLGDRQSIARVTIRLALRDADRPLSAPEIAAAQPCGRRYGVRRVRRLLRELEAAGLAARRGGRWLPAQEGP